MLKIFHPRRVHDGVLEVRAGRPRDPAAGGGRVQEETGGGRAGRGRWREEKEEKLSDT